MVENSELREKIQDDADKYEKLQNELLMLQARRYIVERKDVEQVSDARLGDIEMQLFRSL